jgi:hypothetical protein
VDDGETANTQVTWFDFGGKQLIFEVRGLRTPALKQVSVGNIIYCTDGYLVFGPGGQNYNLSRAYDLDGNLIQTFNGPDDHYANWISGIRSGRQQDLRGQPLEGHLSSALCHLANLSYRLGRPQPFEPRQHVFTGSPEAQNALVTMEEHLQSNNVPLTSTSLIVGRRLTLDPNTERFIGDDEANKLLTREYRKGFEVPARA